MADSKTDRGGRDRGRIAAGQGYELGYFARKHGIRRDRHAISLDASATIGPS